MCVSFVISPPSRYYGTFNAAFAVDFLSCLVFSCTRAQYRYGTRKRFWYSTESSMKRYDLYFGAKIPKSNDYSNINFAKNNGTKNYFCYQFFF